MPEFDNNSPVRPTSETENNEHENLEAGLALCLSGGGYRAMVFHLGALWRLNESGALKKLSRVSSVSGGSITAAVLGMNWRQMQFNAATGVAAGFKAQVVDPIRKLADRTIDAWSIIVGGLLPGITASDRVAAAYDKHLFKDKKLSDLPSDKEGPRFVINATNVQTGTLWRFSRPYMGDYRVGLIRNPEVSLAKAVAASSAFPPVLSPCELDVDPKHFDPATTKGETLFEPPYNDEVALSDGGVYDNLGLETAYKRYKTILVSDGGQKIDPQPDPDRNWAGHAFRVLGIIDNQVRSLRKRLLVAAYLRGDRDGAYWGIGSRFADYQLSPDPLGLASKDAAPLAAVPTRLERMDSNLQERLINWGYAICDTALRKHSVAALKAHGVTVNNPTGLPYREAGL